MEIADFVKPNHHPWSMLAYQDYSNTSQEEEFLAYMLAKCVDAGEFISVKANYAHNELVKTGLLEEVSEKEYVLTKKALGFLYTQYAA